MDAMRYRARGLRNSATDAECRLWQHLRLRQLGGFRFRRQVSVGGYIADFTCPEVKLIVELDGGQHLDRVAYDARRTRMLEAKGYKVLRYWNDDVLIGMDIVLEDILRTLLELESKSTVKSTPPQSSPSPAAKGRRKSRSNDESEIDGV